MRPALARRSAIPAIAPDAEAVLESLTGALLVIDPDQAIRRVNPAAEQLFGIGRSALCAQRIDQLLRYDSPVLALVTRARDHGETVSEFGRSIELARLGRRTVDLQISPLADTSGWVLMVLHETSMASLIERQLGHRSAVRSVAGLAAMLAHEVKNPLAGIRGAAQLLEQTVRAEDRGLTSIIREEVDRICAMVDRMDAFADARPFARAGINIHEVLERVVRIVRASAGTNVRIVEAYDPSLPPTYGNRDQLIQVFLNLAKNALEAVGESGEIVVGTAYHAGLRIGVSGGQGARDLPLIVRVQDNGPGIAAEVRTHLFEPFVTTKASGSGLGLSLVARIVEDHGGIVEVESTPRRTVFLVRLPTADEREEA